MEKGHGAPALSRVFERARRLWIKIPIQSDRAAGGMNKRLVDALIGNMLFVVALCAILAVFFIFVFLLRDGYQIFLDAGF
jgi:phosphate transport system permease protein